MSKGKSAPYPAPGPRQVTSRGIQPAKQIAHEVLPSRNALASIVKGDQGQRTISQYGKMTPADANGVGTIGLNINSMARGV